MPMLDTKKVYSFASREYGIFNQALSLLVEDETIPEPDSFIFHLTRKPLADRLLLADTLPSLEECVRHRMNPLLIDLAGKNSEMPVETLAVLREDHGSAYVDVYLALETCNPAHVRVCKGMQEKKWNDVVYTLRDVISGHLYPEYDFVMHDGTISFGTGKTMNFVMHDGYRVTALECAFFSDWAKHMGEWISTMESLTCDTVILNRSADPRLSQLQSDIR